MRTRLLIAAAVLLAATLVTAPAQANLNTWGGLTGLNAASGANWVREYATGLPPTTIYAATEGDGVWKSVNDGLTWTNFSSGLECACGAMNVRTVYTSGTTVYAGTTAGLFMNPGTGWTPVAQGPEDDPAHPKNLNQAVQAVLSPIAGQMLAGVASGGVYKSSDSGKTWQPPAPGNGMASSETVWSFAQLIPGSVFAATSSGIYRSLDGGSTWQLKSDGISGTMLRVAADSHRPNIFYAVGSGGVYRTINFGETWSDISGSGSSALLNTQARALTVFSGVDQTRLYVGTENGVWVGTTGNGVAPGPVRWRKVTNDGLGNNTIFWALTNFLTTPGTLLGGTQSDGGYALTFQAPANTAPPVVSASNGLTVGQTLGASHGTWSGTQTIEYEYQWQQCTGKDAQNNGTGCTDISNATDPTYVLDTPDKTKYMRVQVQGENDFPTFSLNKVSSKVVGPITANPNTLPGANQSSTASIGAVTGDITLPQSGDKLTAKTWLFNPAATSTTFQWLRCDSNGAACHPIAGATGLTYTLTDDDVTLRLRVQVTGTNANGSTTLDPSGATNTIFPQEATQTAPAEIHGDAIVGETLISTVGKWKYPGTTYQREWLRCEADGSDCVTLTGETAPGHTLVDDDLGHRMRVRITADSNEANHFPDPVEVLGPLSDVVQPAPVPQSQPQPGGGGGQPGGGGSPQPAPTPDTLAPVFQGLSLASSKSKHGGSLSLKYAVSEGGTLSIKFQRLVAGRKVGKTCKAGAHKGKKCTALKAAGSATVSAAKAGTAAVSVKKLAAGSYRALVTPVDAAGNRGAARTLSFSVKR